MSLRVLFFASLTDVVGRRSAELSASQYTTVGSVFAGFAGEFPRLEEYRGSILFALNSEFASPETEVKDGDEIAFFPPVSGG
jgi:molybdopterin converting factor subunit 1